MQNLELETARLHASFQGLDRLRHGVRNGDTEATREVATQFEALFIQMMLKTMRASVPQGGMFDSNEQRLYQDIFDGEIAGQMAVQRGFGIADMLLREFGVAPQPPSRRAQRMQPIRPEFLQPVNAAAIGDINNDDIVPEKIADPAMFAARLTPLASSAARDLGVTPEVLVAQAALETGWGQHVIRHADGASSHNLFGIKAGPDWKGPRASVPTLEFRDGQMRRETAQFRGYASFAASFADYVKLVQTEPRYASARTATSNEAYVQALQAGGYATDPQYAEKIIDILRRDTILRTADASAVTVP